MYVIESVIASYVCAQQYYNWIYNVIGPFCYQFGSVSCLQTENQNVCFIVPKLSNEQQLSMSRRTITEHDALLST